MRVLHYSPRYYPYIGGSELYCQEHSQRLARDGHHVSVQTTNAFDIEYFWDPSKRHLPAATENHNGVLIRRHKVRHLPWSRWSYGSLRHIMAGLSRFSGRSTSILSLLCRLTPWVPTMGAAEAHDGGASCDLVHATNISFESIVYDGLGVAKRLGVPMVITPFVHLGEPGSAAVRRFYTMPHQVRMMQQCDRVIVQTKLERDYVVGLGVREEHIRRVGVGIDPECLSGGQAERFRRKHGLSSAIVFYIGVQAPDKGTVHLIEAMKHLWDRGLDAHLVLAGHTYGAFGEYFGSLPTAVRERCRLLGFVSEEEKRDLLAAGDVMVMPSRTDSFGIAYLEAWLYGKPVVGALAGGVPDVISDGEDGYLVPFGDVACLAQAIEGLLSHPSTAQALGARGHQKALSHTWAAKYAQVREIYEELVTR